MLLQNWYSLALWSGGLAMSQSMRVADARWYTGTVSNVVTATAVLVQRTQQREGFLTTVLPTVVAISSVCLFSTKELQHRCITYC
jgi:hypothetical protein